MKDIIKRVILAIIVILIVVGAIFLFLRKTDYSEINYKEFSTMLEKKDTFILVIGSANCTHCKSFHATMKKVISKYQLDVKYIDVSKLSNDEKSELTTVINYGGTPTTVFITNGVEESSYNRIDGNKSYEKVIDKLIKNGYIKEA